MSLAITAAIAVISIHALREEGDVGTMNDSPLLMVFQSTPSTRRATDEGGEVWEGSLISIHALREEDDLRIQDVLLSQLLISIHALREEGDRKPF